MGRETALLNNFRLDRNFSGKREELFSLFCNAEFPGKPFFCSFIFLAFSLLPSFGSKKAPRREKRKSGLPSPLVYVAQQEFKRRRGGATFLKNESKWQNPLSLSPPPAACWPCPGREGGGEGSFDTVKEGFSKREGEGERASGTYYGTHETCLKKGGKKGA